MLRDALREDFKAAIETHVPNVRIVGTKATGHVPWREDHHPSFSANVENGTWYDHGRQEGGGVKEFKARLGLNGATYTSNKIVAIYPYHDENGRLLYEVVRFEPKDFRQRKPDGHGGWHYKLEDTRRVPYRLPEILKAQTVYVCEGEKDCDKLWSLGIPATTNPGGAGKWRDEYSEHFRGKQIVIIPDNDEPGERHAQQIARSLLPVAKAVKLVHLPGLPPIRAKHGEDVSYWSDAGHSKEELADIVKATPFFALTKENAGPVHTSTGFSFTKLADLLNEPEENVEWLVDKMLPTSGFSLLVAKPKVGKTTLARNLALSVAQGKEFLNRTTQQGAVIYLALEEKRSEVKKHFVEMNATGNEEIYIHAASAPVDGLEQIRAIAQEKKPALIIIDPLFRFTRVKDGNDYSAVSTALEPLLVLARETGAHVLCVHHAGKGDREGGDSILGSTAIFAAVDTALIMKRTERYRTLSSTQRYGEDLPETVLRFDPQSRTISLGESREREDISSLKDLILNFLKDQEEAVTEQEIKATIEGNNRHKQTALRQLVDEKQIERDGTGKKGNAFKYKFSLSHFSIYTKSESENPKPDVTTRNGESYSHFSTSQFSSDIENPGSGKSEHSEVWEAEL